MEVITYCVELQGLHALLLAIKGFCFFHAVTSRSVTIQRCDNLGALHKAQQIQELTPCSTAHDNLIQAIHQVCHTLTETMIHFKHVKGHQDDLHSASSLSCLAQLYILADQLAKHSLLCLLQHHQYRVGLLVGNAWSLQVAHQTITSDLQPHIIWHLGYCTAYKYMVDKKQNISFMGFNLINFPALTTALKSASPLHWLWYSKFVSGHSATGCMMCLWAESGIMISALAVAITQKQLDMSSSALILVCILHNVPS